MQRKIKRYGHQFYDLKDGYIFLRSTELKNKAIFLKTEFKNEDGRVCTRRTPHNRLHKKIIKIGTHIETPCKENICRQVQLTLSFKKKHLNDGYSIFNKQFFICVTKLQ